MSVIKILFSYLIGFFLPLVWSQTNLIQPIGTIPTTAISTTQGIKTYYSITFRYTGIKLSSSVQLQVAYPPEIPPMNIDVNNILCYLEVIQDQVGEAANTGIYSECQIDFTRRLISFSIDVLTPNNYQLIFGKIINPISISQTGQFGLSILQNGVVVSNNKSLGNIYYTNPPVQIRIPQVQMISNSKINEGSSWLFTMALMGVYPEGHSLRIGFPEGFSTNSVSCEVQIADVTVIAEANVLFDKRTIECRNISLPMKGQVIVKIINMVNPINGGIQKGFTIEQLEGRDSTLVNEYVQFDGNIMIGSNPLTVQVIQQDQFKYSNTSYLFSLLPQQDINQGFIHLEFGPQWNLWKSNCTVQKGLIPYQYMSGQIAKLQEFSCFTNNFTHELFVTNFNSAPAQEYIQLLVNLESPQKEGVYPVKVSTCSQDMKIIETQILNININSTFGRLKEFRSHPLTDGKKLKAGKTGPLEFTFFLKNNLPQSNVQTTGKLVVEIYPQLNKPSIALNQGVIKCFFYEDIIAQNCNFDNSVPGKTTITIYTPENSNFQESEIPISVTTEGAVPPNVDGITLDPLVQRYLFQVHFYDSDSPTAVPTEVYLQEWIPDPFELQSATLLPLVQEQNEYTHLQITFQNEINLSMPNKNYLFRIELENGFVSGAGQNGFINKVKQDYPCYIYNQFPQTSLQANPNVKCDLYNYVSSGFPFPEITYIQAYGFNTLPAGAQVILEIPQLLISPTATTAKVKFMVIEETPGMIDYYVELYYKEFQFQVFPQSYLPYTINPNIATFQNYQHVKEMAEIRVEWSGAVNTIQHLIYEIPLDFTNFERGKYDDAGTQTSNIKIPAYIQWYVVYQLALLPNSNDIITVIQNLDIKNPIKQGIYLWKVRAMRDGRVLHKHSFNFVVTTAQIANPSFERAGPSTPSSIISNINPQIVGNLDQEFQVKFNLVNDLQPNGQIKYTFINVSSQQNFQLYCQVSFTPNVVTPLNNMDGFRCEKITPAALATYKVWNIGYIPAGALITFNFRLIDNTNSNFTPLANIYVYNQIDEIGLAEKYESLPCLSPAINYQGIQNFTEVYVQNSYQIDSPPRVNYIGPIYIDFTSTNVLNPQKIEITLATGFRTPNNFGVDPLACFMNNVRFDCIYTTSPNMVITGNFQIRINPSGPSSYNQAGTNIKNRIMITTENLSPNEGIVHPPISAYYKVDFKIYDNNGAYSDQGSHYTFVYPQKMAYIFIEAAIRNFATANIFFVKAKTAASQVSYSLGGRIHIEFPTKDQKGNPLFDLNLGGYTKTGDEVGCWFNQNTGYLQAETSKILQCRLIAASEIGKPAIVEVINFQSFTSGTLFEIRIAKIFNPPNSIANLKPDANISIIIFQRDDSTGILTYSEHDTYNLFTNLQIQAQLDYNFVNSDPLWDTGSQVGNQLKTIQTFVWYNTNFNPADYFVFELPSDYFRVTQNIATCTTFYEWCISFPPINWFVVKISTALTVKDGLGNPITYKNHRVILDRLPVSVPRFDVNYFGWAWQNTLQQGKVTFTIKVSDWLQLTGQIYTASIIPLGLSQKVVKNRKNVEVSLNFTTTNYIPNTGGIEIKFNNIPKVHSHCRSSISVGSQLKSISNINSGDVACYVQQTETSWLISGFQEVPPNTNIKIYGMIDLPNIAGNTDLVDIQTYGSIHPTNSFNLAPLIDKLIAVPNTSIMVQNFPSKNIEELDLFYDDISVLRANHIGQLKIRMGIINPVFQNKGMIKVDLFTNTIDGSTGGFTYLSTDKYVCELKQISDGVKRGCRMIQHGTHTLGGVDSTFFIMMPNDDLVNTQIYILTLTTINGQGTIEGLRFPSKPGKYKVTIGLSSDTAVTYDDYKQVQHLYYTVYGDKWNIFEFQSYITIPLKRNIFVFKVSPSVIINWYDQIVIEIPTQSLDGQMLFADGGGLGLNDYDDIPFDIVDFSGLWTAPTLKCKIHFGNQLLGNPLKFVCSNFQDNGVNYNIQTTDYLSLAFDIYNPSVSATQHFSIPVQVYSVDTVLHAQKNYDIFEKGFYIVQSRFAPVGNFNADFNMGPSLKAVCNILAAQFQFKVGHTQNLLGGTRDAYVLRFLFDIRNDNFKAIKPYVYAGAANSLFLSNLKTMILQMNPTNDLLPGTTVLFYSQFWSPWYRLMNYPDRKVVGYASYTHILDTEEIIYKDEFIDIQPFRVNSVVLSMNDVDSGVNTAGGARRDFTFTITAPFFGIVTRVAIVFPITVSWVFEGVNCKQNGLSEIEIESCTVDRARKIIWIDIVKDNSYANDPAILNNLIIETLYLGITSPATVEGGRYVISDFGVKFYTTKTNTPLPNPSALNPSTEEYVCYSDDASMPGFTPYQYYNSQNYNYVSRSDEEYIDEFQPFQRYHQAAFRLDVKSPAVFASLLGQPTNFHELRMYYGDSITVPDQTQTTDFISQRLICYIRSERVKCILDKINKFVSLFFQSNIVVGDNLFIYVSSSDHNDPSLEGLLYTGDDGLYDWTVKMQVFGTTTWYYSITDKQPHFIALNVPDNTPVRVIERGTVSVTTNRISVLNVLEFTLSFSQAGVMGLVFEISIVDEDENNYFSIESQHGLPNGSPFPCGRGLVGAVKQSIKCVVQNGENGAYGRKLRVHAFDFTYTVNQDEIFRLMIKNPTIANSFVDVIVTAWGDNVDFDKPYGNHYFGERRFERQIYVIDPSYCGLSVLQYSTIYGGASPQLSANRQWQEFTFSTKFSDFFGNPCTSYPPTSLLLEVTLEYRDGVLLNNERDLCDFTPNNEIIDIFYLELNTPGSTPYFVRKAFVYKTIVIYTTSYFFKVANLKCRHYIIPFVAHIAYNSMTASDNIRFEIITEQVDITVNTNLATSTIGEHWVDLSGQSFSEPNQYIIISAHTSNVDTWYDQTIENVMSIDFTNQTPAYFQTECYVLQGLSITDSRYRGERVQCQVINSKQILITNWDYIKPGDIIKVQVKCQLEGYIVGENELGTAYFYNIRLRVYANMNAFNNGDTHLCYVRNAAAQYLYGYENYTPALSTDRMQIMSINSVGVNTYVTWRMTPVTNIDLRNFGCSCWCFGSPGCCDFNPRIYVYLYGLDWNFAQGTTCSLNSITRVSGGGIGTGSVACYVINTSYHKAFQIDYFPQMWNHGNYWTIGETIEFTMIVYNANVPDRNQIWMRSRIQNTRGCVGTWLEFDQKDFWVPPKKGISAAITVSAISYNVNTETEMTISVINLAQSIGFLKQNVLMIEFKDIAGGLWNDDLIFGTDSTDETQRINCKCTNIAGILIDSECYRRRRQPGGWNPSILIYETKTAGTDLLCYIPEITLPALAGNYQLVFRYIYPSDYTDYRSVQNSYTDNTGGSYNTPSEYVYSYFQVIYTTSPASAIQHVVDPTTFYDKRITNEIFVGHYQLDINNIPPSVKPYIYVRHGIMGPIPTTELCTDPALFSLQRTYTQLTYVSVCQSTNANTVKLTLQMSTLATIQFPDAVISTVSDWRYKTYLFKTTGELIDSKQEIVPYTAFQPDQVQIFKTNQFYWGNKKATFPSLHSITFSMKNFVIPEFRFNGRIIVSIPYTEIPSGNIHNGCAALILGQSSMYLICQYIPAATQHEMHIYRRFSSFNTPNQINVYFHLINPTKADVTFSLQFYKRYTTSTNYAIQVQNTYKEINFDITDSANTRIGAVGTFAQLKNYKFVTKLYLDNFFEERIRFQWSVGIPADQVLILKQQIARGYGGNHRLYVRYREYDPTIPFRYKHFPGRLDINHQYWIPRPLDYQGAGQMVAFGPRNRLFTPGYRIEIILTYINRNDAVALARSTLPSEVYYFLTYGSGGATLYQTSEFTSYQYQGRNAITLHEFYYTSAFQQDISHLHFTFTIRDDITIDVHQYPVAYMELIFKDLPINLLPGPYTYGQQFPCSLSDNFVQITSPSVDTIQPRCLVFPKEQDQNSWTIFRIEHFGRFGGSNQKIWISIDDVKLVGINQQFTPLNFIFKYYRSQTTAVPYQHSNLQMNYKEFRELFFIDGVNLNVQLTSIKSDIKALSSNTFGVSGVTYQVDINWDLDTVKYSDLVTSTTIKQSGYKIRFKFTQGIIVSNDVDKLGYEDNNGDYTVLWYNRPMGSIYLSPPKALKGSIILFQFYKVSNPWPYQMAAFGNPVCTLTYYSGIQLEYTGQAHQLRTVQPIDFSLKGQWGNYQIELPMITISSSLSNNLDTHFGFWRTKGEHVTFHIRFTINISIASLKQRHFVLTKILLLQGFTDVDECYISLVDKVTQTRFLNFPVGTLTTCTFLRGNPPTTPMSIEIRGLQDLLGTTENFEWDFYMRTTINNPLLQYQVIDYVDNGQMEHLQTVNYNLLQYDEISYKSLPIFDPISLRYFKGYSEMQIKNNFAQTSLLSSRLRFRFLNDLPLTYDYINPEFLKISLPKNDLTNFQSQNKAINTPKALIQCHFIPELQKYGGLGLPLWSWCSFGTSSNPYFYTLQAPIQALTAGQIYHIHIQEWLYLIDNVNEVSTQFIFPNTNLRSEFLFESFQPYNSASPSYDTFITYIYLRFINANIFHYTVTKSHYDVVEVKITPSFTLQTAIPGVNEAVVIIDIESNYYDQDLGIQNTFSSDITLKQFINGQTIPLIMNPPSSTAKLVLSFGQFSASSTPIRFIVNSYSDYTAGASYTIKLPMIQNPSSAYFSHYYTIRTVFYAAENLIPTIYNKFSFMNHISVDDNLVRMGANLQITAVNDMPQRNDMGITMSLNYNLNTKNIIMIKYDNNQQGLITPEQIALNTVTNTNLEFYPRFNLVILFMTASTTSPSLFNLGSTYLTSDFILPWGYSFIYNTYTLQQITLQYETPTPQLLKPIPDLINYSLTRDSGINTIYSENLYIIKFNTPKIPEGGYIEVNLGINMAVSKHFCYLLPNLKDNAVNFNNGSLNCQYMRILNKHIIKGFGQVATGSTITIKIFAINLQSGLGMKIQSIILYGTTNSSNLIVASQQVGGVDISAANVSSQKLSKVLLIDQYIYAQEWSKFYFSISSFYPLTNTDTLNFIMGSSYSISTGSVVKNRVRYDFTNPYLITDNWKETPSWVTSPFTFSAANCEFSIQPPNFSNWYIPAAVRTDFWLDSEMAQSAMQDNYEGILNPDRDMYRFWLEHYDGTNTLKQKAYFEYILKPREDIQNTFKVLVLNRSYGQKTLIRFTFTMNYDMSNIGDEIHIEFQCHNKIQQVFKDDLGFTIQDNYSTPLSCRESPNRNMISTSRINCQLYKGDNVNGPFRNAYVKIKVQKTIRLGDIVEFWIANIENPVKGVQYQLDAGIRLSIMKPCREDGKRMCPIYQADTFYYPMAYSGATDEIQSNSMKATPDTVTVFARHDFSLNFLQQVNAATDYIIITYPKDNHRLYDTCISMSGWCIEFESENIVLFKPGANIAVGQNTFDLSNMQNGWYRQALPTPLYNFKLQVQRNGVVIESFIVKQDIYSYYEQNISTQLINTQADPYLYFLKENYVNVAKLTVKGGIWLTQDIQYFRISKPPQIQQYIINYCNATLTVDIVNRYPYPYRFDCIVNTNYIMLSLGDQFPPYTPLFNTYDIIVYFKFIIDDQIPPMGIAPGISDTFYIYGCVINCNDPLDIKENMHVTRSPINFMVSPRLQPNIGQINFEELSYSDRNVQMNDQCELYMLFTPMTDITTRHIDRVVLEVADEFIYPPKLTLDSCEMFGTKQIALTECSVERRYGKTRITVRPQDYDHLVKMLKLTDSGLYNGATPFEPFKAPEYPGDFYPITIELYSQNVLTDKQTVNITTVNGIDFDNSKITVINGLDQLRAMLYEVSFQNGQYAIPQGFDQPSKDVYSEIQIIFEWIGGGFQIYKGFELDLGTGLSDGENIGCTARSYVPSISTVSLVDTLRFSSDNRRIACILKHGQGADYMPRVIVRNYDEIEPYETVTIKLTKIQNLSSLYQTTVKIGVSVFLKKYLSSAYLYNPSARIPDQTMTPYIDINNNKPTTIVASGGLEVFGMIDYTFTFQPTIAITTNDYLVIQFPNNFFNQYDSDDITSPTGFVFCFPESSMLYFKPITTLNANVQYTIVFNNAASPYYSVQGTFMMSAYSQVNRRIAERFSFSLTIQTNPCDDFSYAGVQAVNSIMGGETYVQYKFTFVLNHEVPSNGAISIVFPQPYEGMEDLKLVCDLDSQFLSLSSTEADSYIICQQVNKTSMISILLNDVDLTLNGSFSFTISGLFNPNIDMSSYDFIIRSHFTNQVGPNNVICSKEFPSQIFFIQKIRYCDFQAVNQFKNVGFSTSYTFYFTCSNPIQEGSQLQIWMPIDYSNLNPDGIYTCTSNPSYILSSQDCYIQKSNDQQNIILNIPLHSISNQSSFSISTVLTNPSIVASFAKFDSYFLSNGYQYAQDRETSLVSTIENKDLIIADQLDSNIQIRLQNIPQNQGESASYIFQLPPPYYAYPQNYGQAASTTINLYITFPSNFQMDTSSSEITCGLHLGISDDMQFFTYKEVLIRDTDVKYKSVNCTVLSDTQVILYDVGNIVVQSQQQWIYWFINGVKNPNEYVEMDFSIIYSLGLDYMTWLYQKPIYYYISSAAQYLQIDSITMKDNSTNAQTPYVFQIRTKDVLQQQLNVGVLVEMPKAISDNFESINQVMKCSLSVSSLTYSICSKYSSFILIEENSTISFINPMIQIVIDSLMNPSVETLCYSISDINTSLGDNFNIQILDLSTKQVLFKAANIDAQSCLNYEKNRFSIQVIGPEIIHPGIANEYTIILEQPANDLQIIPSSSISGIQFQPKIVQFKNYTSSNGTFSIHLSSSVTPGPYSISYQKIENDKKGFIYYQNVINTDVEIVSIDDTSMINSPTIRIDDIESLSLGYAMYVPIHLSHAPADSFYLIITSLDNRIESTTTQNLIIKPNKIYIDSNTLETNFTITYTGGYLPEYCILQFSISSLHKVVHVLQPAIKYLNFKQSNTLNTYPPLMQMSLNTNQQDKQPQGLNSPILNKYTSSRADINKYQQITSPEILSYQSTNIKQNSIDGVIITSQESVVYWTISLAGSQKPQSEQIISGTYDSSIGNGEVFTTQRVPEAVDYTQSLTIVNGLKPQRSYTIFMIAQSAMGYSDIFSYTFKTKRINPGAIIQINLSEDVPTEKIIDALSSTLRVPSNRLNITTSDALIQSQKNSMVSLQSQNNLAQGQNSSNKATAKITYEICLSPSEDDGEYSPIAQANNLKNLKQIQNLLKSNLPQYMEEEPILTRELIKGKTKIITNPILLSVGFYDATIAIDLWEGAQVSAIALEATEVLPSNYRDYILNNKTQIITMNNQYPTDEAGQNVLDLFKNLTLPLAQQILAGDDIQNNELLYPRQYKIENDITGRYTVYIDDLNEDTDYVIFIAATNILPYYPRTIIDDDEIVALFLTTSANYNVDQCAMLDEVTQYSKDLANVLQKYIDNTLALSKNICLRVKNLHNNIQVNSNGTQVN